MWGSSSKQNATGGEIAGCLCKQLMRRNPVRPSLRYSAVRNEFLMFCPSCGIRTYPANNKHSVIAEWNGMNRPGDPYIAELWEEKFYRQQNAPTTLPADPANCVTTDTHERAI